MLPRTEIKLTLQAWSAGDPHEQDQVMTLVVDELRRCVRFYFQRENARHTLQPIALVNEACLRLIGWKRVRWENRKQFFSFAGLTMRRIL